MSATRAPSYPLNHALVISRPQSARRGELPGGYRSLSLALDTRFKPDRVALIFDRRDAEYARSVENLLIQHSIDVELWEVNLLALDEVSHLLMHHLDAWGAPLPLCLSTQNALLDALTTAIFVERGAPILCVVRRDLYRVGPQSQRTRLSPQLKIPQLLTCLGARLSQVELGGDVEPHLQLLSQSLFDLHADYIVSLEVIQRLAREVPQGQLISDQLKGLEVSGPHFQQILDLFESAGCLELSRGRLFFTSDLHRAYCAGGWLALYVASKMRSLDSELEVDDMRWGLRLELAYPHLLELELPWVTLIEGQLCIYFCVNSSREDLHHLSRASEILQERFGAFVIWLCLDELSPPDQLRAQQLDIYLCSRSTLPHVSSWMLTLLR